MIYSGNVRLNGVQKRTKGQRMSPDEIHKMEESHTCGGCDSLVVEVEFTTGEKEDIGCKCEMGGSD